MPWSSHPAGSTAHPAALARQRASRSCTRESEIEVGEPFVHESIIGGRFEAMIEELTTVGSVPAVIPSVAGQAYLTDVSQVGLDPADPLPPWIHAV